MGDNHDQSGQAAGRDVEVIDVPDDGVDAGHGRGRTDREWDQFFFLSSDHQSRLAEFPSFLASFPC